MIELKSQGNDFSLFYKNRKILEHSKKNPCITLGQGNASYKTYKHNFSSFKIRDRISQKNPLSEWKVKKESDSELIITFDNTLTIKFTVDQERLTCSFLCSDKDVNRFWISLNADAEEHIYGCGEQFSELDLRGEKVPLWVEEQGVGRGKDLITLLAQLHSGAGGNKYTTYFPQPTFVSSSNWSCHVETTCYAEFDFRNKVRHTLEIWEVPKKIIIDVQESAAETIGALSQYLGRQTKLPDWCYDGVWLGVQGGSEQIDRKLNDALKSGVKITALWAQDWEGIKITSFGKQLMWNWKYDQERYRGLPEYIKELKKKNVNFLGYINPMLDQEGDLYKEALEKDYLVKNPDGSVTEIYITTFPVGLMDLTNPEAVEWYKGIIKEHMIDIGLSGWMADYGEALPANAVVHSGESGESLHNNYPALWAKANQEAVEEAGKTEEITYFMRAGYTGSSKYSSSIWAGDQLVNWSFDDGLATVIPAGLSLGFCGIGHHHSDIGGFTSLVWIKRSKELFMRWADHCAFTQTMRTHESNRPDTNWQFNSDQETLDHFAKMSKIYVALKTYHKHLAMEYQERGLPPMRHPYIHYENDEVLHSLKYQYMYGEDLMVAPVIKPGKNKMKVYLPDDNWIYLWSGKSYGKGWHKIPAPLGKPPVFFREGSEFKKLFMEIKNI